jgi:Protein of unknown function (DUF3515)
MLVAGAVACAAAVGGCGASEVEVSAPTQGPRACTALVAQLPRTVAGQQPRAVSPARALAGAWGDPAIVLRCGVPAPPALGPASSCAVVNHVGWFAEERADGFRFTTIGRSANVQVSVPYEYEPAANALIDLAHAVRSTVPQVDPCV